MQKKSNKINFLNKILIIITLLVMSIASASAAGWTIPDSIILGSNSQSRDAFAIATLSITNTDNSTQITNLNAVFNSNIVGYTNSNFNVTTQVISSQINPSNSTSITVQGYVPKKFDSGQKQIGTMLITGISGGQPLSKTVPVFMNAESNLNVEEVNIDVNDDSERVSEGETIEVKRGDKITLTVSIENKFSSSSDITIEDINVLIESGNDLDIDEEESLGDLEARDNDEITVSFDIPDDADDGKETITITVDGVDENDATHKTIFEFEIDVEVKTYDVQINSITSNSQNSLCIGETGEVKIDLENTGSRDLEEAMIYVESDDFEFTKKINGITLDEGDSKTLTIQVPVKSNMAAGTYFLEVTAYSKASTSSETDNKEGIFNVKKCTPIIVTPTQPQTNNIQKNNSFEVISQGNQIVQPTNQGQTSGEVFGVQTYKRSITSDWVYIALLIAGCIIVVLLIILIMRSGKAYY